MHEILDVMEEINLDTFEYCTLTSTVAHTSASFPIYVPKLMAGIPYGQKKSWNDSVSDIFLNSTMCEIKFNKNVKLQNYLTIPRFLDTDFSYRADSSGNLHKGTKFLLQSIYGNPKEIYLERVL